MCARRQMPIYPFAFIRQGRLNLDRLLGPLEGFSRQTFSGHGPLVGHSLVPKPRLRESDDLIHFVIARGNVQVGAATNQIGKNKRTST